MEYKFKEIEVPKELDTVVAQRMEQVRSESKRRQKRKWISRAVGAAACLSIISLGVSNPVIAAKLPLIGHIFDTMQDNFSYKGDYKGIGEVLTSNTEITDTTEIANNDTQSNPSATDLYTQTVDGVTVTLSEVYCNQQAIYLSMEFQSEEAIPDIYGPQLFTLEKYSFNPSELRDCPVFDGKRLDDHTYVGLIRLDLNEKVIDTSKIAKSEKFSEGVQADEAYYDLLNVVEVPDTFTLHLAINKIWGCPKDSNWRDEEGLTYQGPWEFTLNITKNTDDTTVIDLADQAENGIGFSSIAKDRFELTVYGLNKSPEDMGDYYPVILDAEGKMMQSGLGGIVNTVAINDSDISTVSLYLVEDDLWLNSLKGEWWKTPGGLKNSEDLKAFKALLDEKCAYQTVVHFEAN